jgi:glycosyltransferase involved in cell wall biosynthesis
MAADREESKLVVKKVEVERATSEKQNVSLQNTLSQIRQEMKAGWEAIGIRIDRFEQAMEEVNRRLSNNESMNSLTARRIDDVGEYAAKIRKAVVSPSSYLIPAPFSWYSYLNKMLNIREPVWLNKEERSREAPKSPGFWRRLERSIRKRRKRWINRIGFDQDWYLKEYPDVKEAGLDPLSHFIEFGQKEGRHKNAKQQEVHGKASAAFNINRQKDLASPNNILKQEKIFDENFYLEKYPDVKETKMKAWDHFVRHGHHEGRLVHKIDFSLITSEVSLSVIIPTYNGQQKISRTIEAISKASHGLDIELIIVNDGSSDQTESVVQALSSKIKNIKLISIKQSGAGIARNTGAKVASKEILLFMGDDISPIGPQFFNVHAVLHKINPQINYSVLGKVEWPDDSYFPITPVMEHIQGSGGEQFGYTDMRPNMFWDWRFFYTCNVSVKRQVVSDWEAEGFDTSFAGCGFEDTEFACRMSKKYGSFNIFYSDQSVGSHYHHHTFLTFFQRQALCGSQLTNLIKLHPECAGKTGVEEVLKILNKNNSNDPELAYKTLESIRQIKRLTLDLEAGGLLGRYEWHKELLHATFRLAYFLGFLNSHAKPNQGYAEALTYIFNNAVRPLVPHLPTSFARP